MQSALERGDVLAMLDAGRRPDASRCALAAVPMTRAIHRIFMPVNAGCTPGSPGIPDTASLGRRCSGFSSREHGVQPRVGRSAVAVSDAGDKDSSESAAGRVGAVSSAKPPVMLGCGFRASSLVTFFWPRRRKLPGRRDGLPAMHRADTRSAKATRALIDAPPTTNPAAAAATPNPQSTRPSRRCARSSRHP